jgi:hypothetical protein
VSNTLLTISYITNEGLDVLENNLVFSAGVDRQYSNEFAVKNAKIGATVNIRRPPRYIGTFGPALNVEDTNETYIPVSLNSQFHVDVQFTTADLLLSMDLFRTRVLSPMMATIANRIDSDGCYFAYQNTASSVGTPGTPPSSFLPFALASAFLANESAPADVTPRLVLDPFSMAYAADGIKGLYNPQAAIGEYIRRGQIAKDHAGLDWFRDQNVVSFTTGAQGGTPLLTANTAGAFLTTGWAQSGFIETNGWTATTGVIKVGDIIQIAGVYPANPQSRTQYGTALKQFVVLPPGGYVAQPSGAASPGLAFAAATLTSGTFAASTGVYTSGSGAGALSIKIGECVISGGQFQNVVTTAAFTTTSALTVNGGTSYAAKVSPQGIVYHKNAFALAFADLPLPGGVQMAERAARAASDDVGMSIRLVTQYTINNDAEPTRADVLYGWSGLYRSMAVRVAG